MPKDKIRYILTSPLDGGNRGCEAICKGTAQILGLSRNEIISYSSDVKLDERLGLSDQMGLLSSCKKGFSVFDVLYQLTIMLPISERLKKRLADMHVFIPLLNEMKKNDVALSDGGDLFCYQDINVIYINHIFHLLGIKSVLWACSIGKSNLNREKVRSLKKFDVIVARESYTFRLLTKLFPRKKIYCAPDPAFVLKPEECKLPNCFSNRDVVGINMSNFVGKEVGVHSLFGRNMIKMINYILDNTNMDIVLIPHVFWKEQDDAKTCKMIKNYYRENNRVHYINTFVNNYCQIRYIISKCRFFVGARTHAMISAYSTSVPALALGYSVKSRGIAKDIGLDSKLVVDYDKLKTEEDLLEAFCYMMDNEDEIKRCYERNISQYINKAYNLNNILFSFNEVGKTDRSN